MTLPAVILDAARAARPLLSGSVTGVLGLAITVEGVTAAVGDVVTIHRADVTIPTEVVAVGRDRVTCMPLGEVTGVSAGDRAVATGAPVQVPVGPALLGRVLDGLGTPIDGKGALHGEGVDWVDIHCAAPHPLERPAVREPLALGVRALDTMVPVGKGQRLGIFAGSGVGKSTLMAQITRGTSADVRVIALIGERGREVREFLDETLGPDGLDNTVVVVATSDQPPLVRLKAAFLATRIAEGFRDAGRDVLLLMDSITRTAMAQREVGLSAGEPPTTRGYPPSVFAMMPRLLERAGTSARGSITGLYTVLVDGDDHNEPIADTARSILDGHVVLTRALATAGHFPAIDVLESISRVQSAVTTKDQRATSVDARRLLGALRDVKELVEIGAYQPGADALVDRARQVAPLLDGFLRQDLDDVTSPEQAWQRLGDVVGAA